MCADGRDKSEKFFFIYVKNRKFGILPLMSLYIFQIFVYNIVGIV